MSTTPLQDGQQPLAWYDPDWDRVVTAAQLHSMQRHQGTPGKSAAKSYTVALAAVSQDGQQAPSDRTQRRVVCAAIRAADGEVLLGIRHYSADMHRQIKARKDGAKFCRRHDPDQGFVDQWGAYLTREEAYVVAQACGQGLDGQGLDGPKLYSEGLY